MTAIALAVAGLVMCLAACAGAVWSYRAFRGTPAGASLSAACLVLGVAGFALAVGGAVASVIAR